jgi:hypothetical protein
MSLPGGCHPFNFRLHEGEQVQVVYDREFLAAPSARLDTEHDGVLTTGTCASIGFRHCADHERTKVVVPVAIKIAHHCPAFASISPAPATSASPLAVLLLSARRAHNLNFARADGPAKVAVTYISADADQT